MMIGSFKHDAQLQTQLDRLAANEITDEEQTRLLQTLQNASAWRQCALTLIEAQQLRSVMEGIVAPGFDEFRQPRRSEPSPQVSPVLKQTRTVPHIASVTHRAVAIGVAMAALMFLLGWSVGRDADGRHVADGVETADAQDEFQHVSAPGEFSESAIPPVADIGESEGTRVVGHAQIHRQFGTSSRMPVLAGAHLKAAALLNEPTGIPESVRRQARNSGFDVRGHLEVVSVELFSGVELTIPLQELGVRYVGHEVF